MLEKPLSHKNIAVPESRQLDILADMLKKRGATVLRYPLVTILDTPNSQPVYDWLKLFVTEPFDEFIVLTGEGIRRLLSFADKIALKKDFIATLPKSRIIARGPKPGQALKAINLKPDILAKTPTTAGIIETLKTLDLTNKRVGVQLYGDNPNTLLMEYLNKIKADVHCVAPYVYASDSEDEKVLELIEKLSENTIDAITFTSKPQYTRLHQVAKKYNLTENLAQGLEKTTVAAVGPIVAETLEKNSVKVDLMPESSYFMKPMVSKLIEVIAN